MNTLPLWAEIAVALLVVLGATLALIGAWGLVTLPRFYDRLHAPAVVASWGNGAIILAVILASSLAEGRFSPAAIVVGVFIMVTSPVTMMVLTRATLQRDRAEGADVPSQAPVPEEPITPES